jgi:capsid portal protein
MVDTRKARGEDPDGTGAPLIPDGTGASEKDSWKDTDVITPKMPPENLVDIYRKSSEVPKNARARGQNVSGYGWTLKPVVNFEDPNLEEKATQWIFMDRVAQWRREISAAAQNKDTDAIQTLTKNPPVRPTEAEVSNEIAAWKERAVMERAILQIRLETLCVEWPFEDLIKKTEINRAGLSYAGWEILRDPVGTPVRAKLKEPLGMRATDEDDEPIWVPWLRKTSPVTYEEVLVQRRFRRFVIQLNGTKIWYKEFGAPYVVSQQTGKVYENEKEFEKAKEKRDEPENAQLATEILLWAEYSPGCAPYGMPIWHGHSLDVETSRLSKDYDYDELANGKIPRGAFTLIDGMLDSPIREGLKQLLRSGGAGNRNRTGILEVATSSMVGIAGAGRAVIDFLNFSDAQHDEATHLEMKKRSESGVSQDFGNPGIYLGRTEDVQNRATAETAQHVAEQQTYTALRDLWGWTINQKIVLPWGFRFWTFQLNSPKQQRMKETGAVVKVAVENNILRPDQAIPVVSDLLGLDITEEPLPWQMVPPKAAAQGLTDDFLPQSDEDLEGEEERGPDETETQPEVGSEGAIGLLESFGILAGNFMDGPAQNLRKRLGLSRGISGAVPEGEEIALGPDLMPDEP